MKKLISPLIFCSFSIAMMAQQPAESVDAKATSILQSLDKKTKTYKTISAEFTITQLAANKKAGDPQKGKIWVKGAKYKYDLNNQTVFCDSSTTWTYLKDANEVQINKVDPTSDKGSLSPATIFTLYEKGFKSHFIDEEKVSNVVCECVELYPKHPEKQKYHTLRLYIDKVKDQVIQVTLLMKDGTTSVIVFDKFTPNTAYPDSTFLFDAKSYPGVEIEDLRE